MQRVRNVIGIIAGSIFILSSAAHSLLGWPSLREKLAAATAPADLTTALMIGWHFAGLAMLVFGIIVIGSFAHAIRGESVSFTTCVVIGLAYTLYGVWALAVVRDPFFLIFIVPGLLLLAASWRPASERK
ncbi:MAG TPA: hypothetical protein VGO75_17185 [Gemmatimonadaceae bacterium]|jgi:hypothetical protein|nr:hypothetical protein [Gemmatimonadaceae bacterium]